MRVKRVHFDELGALYVATRAEFRPCFNLGNAIMYANSLDQAPKTGINRVEYAAFNVVK